MHGLWAQFAHTYIRIISSYRVQYHWNHPHVFITWILNNSLASMGPCPWWYNISNMICYSCDNFESISHATTPLVDSNNQRIYYMCRTSCNDNGVCSPLMYANTIPLLWESPSIPTYDPLSKKHQDALSKESKPIKLWSKRHISQ